MRGSIEEGSARAAPCAEDSAAATRTFFEVGDAREPFLGEGLRLLAAG